MRVILLSALILISAVSLACAQGMVTECGTPAVGKLNTEEVANYCDIYGRQLAYDQERKQFKEKLLQRQKNYNAPRTEAYNNYVKNLEALRKPAGNNVGNQ